MYVFAKPESDGQTTISLCMQLLKIGVGFSIMIREVAGWQGRSHFSEGRSCSPAKIKKKESGRWRSGS